MSSSGCKTSSKDMKERSSVSKQRCSGCLKMEIGLTRLSWATADFLPGGCVFVALANELDDKPGPLRDFLVAAQSEWLGTLATAARIATEEGHFRRDLNIEQFAYDFYAIMLAFHHFHQLLRDPIAEARARVSFDRLIAHCR